MNCYYCSLAALKRKTVTELMREIQIPSLPGGAPNIEYIVNLYKKAGFPNAEKIFEGTPSEFLAFLDNNLKNGESTQFSLAFTREDGTGHVVHARVWKTMDGNSNLLTTDFQHAPYTIDRFSTSLPQKAAKLFIVFPMFIRQLGDVDVASRLTLYQNQLSFLQQSAGPGGYKCSNGRRIIGYVPHWSRRPFTILQSLRLTNAIYAFIEMSSNGGLKIADHTMSKERLIDLVLARQAHVEKGLSLKVSFAVGGWENSQYFSNILNNGDSRRFFIGEIDRIMKQYQFDGVDIDWEYPITGGVSQGKVYFDETKYEVNKTQKKC